MVDTTNHFTICTIQQSSEAGALVEKHLIDDRLMLTCYMPVVLNISPPRLPLGNCPLLQVPLI